MTPAISSARRATAAGAVCLAILGGMIVGHAWPLWTGRTVTMKAIPVDPRDLFRGDYVRIDTPAARLHRAGSNGTNPNIAAVRPVGRVFEDSRRGSVVYVQLEPTASGEYMPVSVSEDRVKGALNLRGRVAYSYPPDQLSVEYGLEAFYMQDGTARPVDQAIRQGRSVQMQVAIAASGQARIRTLLIDGVPVADSR